MTRVLVLGAGGAAANGFCRALRMAGDYYLIGTNCNSDDLELAETDERHVIWPAANPHYAERLCEVAAQVKPDLVHAQPDVEVAKLSELRENLPVFLPSASAIRVCHNKWLSHCAWWNHAIEQPWTYWITTRGDLGRAISAHGQVWIRHINGAGGAGSIVTDDPVFAAKWIDRHDGWSRFTAAEVLGKKTCTWTSIWKDGELCVYQGRLRESWGYGRNSPTGVSGITGTARTFSSKPLDNVGERAVRAIDKVPNGIYSVDCVISKNGHDWVPTEINIGRFHTTVPEFFARAGFNIADAYVKIALGATYHVANPLPSGRRWLRTMDKEPVLI